MIQAEQNGINKQEKDSVTFYDLQRDLTVVQTVPANKGTETKEHETRAHMKQGDGRLGQKSGTKLQKMI